MANHQHVAILTYDGVPAWNLWRKEHPDIWPDLSGADLSGADLSRANLSATGLRNAILHGAKLRRAKLSQADLSMADLSGADLSEADLMGMRLYATNLRGANLSDARLSAVRFAKSTLSGANLSGADLKGADLSGADLSRADLSGADLSRADLSWACLSKANLSGADCSRARFHDVDLSRAMCVGTTFAGATLNDCIVYGMSAWDVNWENTTQAQLHISPASQKGHLTVDTVEVAQLLSLLVSNRTVHTLLDTVTSKVVLIVGRYRTARTPIFGVLHEALRRHPNGYIPVLCDFDPERDEPVLEMVKALANFARFAVADLTIPRLVRREFRYILPNVPSLPVQPIMERAANLPEEYATWASSPSFLPISRYADLDHLRASFTEAVITPVEGHVVARRLADADSRDTRS